MSWRPTLVHIHGGGPDSSKRQNALCREGSQPTLGWPPGGRVTHTSRSFLLMGKWRAPAPGTPLAEDLLLCSHHRLQPPLVVQPLMHFLHLYKIYSSQGDLFSTFNAQQRGQFLIEFWSHLPLEAWMRLLGWWAAVSRLECVCIHLYGRGVSVYHVKSCVGRSVCESPVGGHRYI